MLSRDPTFLNQPRAGGADHSAQVAFIGACFDGLARQPGVAQAPRRVREAAFVYANTDGTSQPITVYNPELGFLLDGIRFVDAGDVECSADPRLALPALEAPIAALAAAGQLPLIVGGDHFVTFPAVRALKEPVVVVHFDAHSDYLDELDTCPHGSFMRQVGELPHVRRVVHLGLRGNLQCARSIRYSLERGNKLATSRQLLTGGPDLLLEMLGPDVLGGECGVYVTFDVDVLDPSVAPGTGTHEPGGLPYLLARDLLVDVCRRTRVRGLDFTEFNPRLDWNDLTAKVVVNLIMEAVSAAVRGGQ